MNISKVLDHKGRDVAIVRPEETIAAAVAKLAERRIGAVVVQDLHGKLVGIFSERDLVTILAQEGGSALSRHVSDIMTKHVQTCRPDDRVDQILAVMTRARIRHMPVMENDGIAGIVSIGDLVHHRLDEKELEAAVLLDLSRRHG